MKYFHFFIKCIKSKFHFFALPLFKKAAVLEKSKLYFWAGILYLELKNYPKAAECFEAVHAYRHLIIAYQKLGLYSKAIEIAEQQKYYQIGAHLCEKINNTKKAASFYAYFKSLYAARLYKNAHFYYEAGQCYLKTYQLSSALECFKSCPDVEKRMNGLKQLEEFSIVLYFTKHYEDAFKLFVKLGDYYSALECVKKLKEKSLICQMNLLIGNLEAQNRNYIVAAKFTEPYDKSKALLFYYQGQAVKEAVRLLVEEQSYEKAFHLCLQHNDLDTAYKLAESYNLPLHYAV